jgi:hypothetical protein
MTIPPNIGFEDAPVKARPSPTGPKYPMKRKLSDFFGRHIINVTEVGNGASGTDWSPTIQTAIGLAFPDSNPEHNRILYFPTLPGGYSCRSTIRFRALSGGPINGGFIQGDGAGATQLYFNMYLDGSAYEPKGNPYTTDGGAPNFITPAFLFENVSNTRLEGMSFGGANAHEYDGYVGIYLYCSGGGVCDHNLFRDLSFSNFAVALKIGGDGADQKVRNNIFMGVHVGTTTVINAYRVTSAASTGHSVIGAAVSAAGRILNTNPANGPTGPAPTFVGTNCTYVSPGPGAGNIGNAAGAFAAINGQIAVIEAAVLGGCTMTAVNASSFPMCFLGTRHEANYDFVAGLVSTAPPGGGLAGPVFAANNNVSGTSTTRALQEDPIPPEADSPLIPAGRPPTICVDVWGGGRVHDCASAIGLVAKNVGALPEPGIVAKVAAGSSYVMDAPKNLAWDTGRHPDAGPNTGMMTVGFAGTGNVFIRGLQFRQKNSNPPDGDTGGWWPATVLGMTFGGTFIQLTEYPLQFAVTPSDGHVGLPPASNLQFAGTRFTMTDSAVAATGNYWASVTSGTGTATNVVPVFHAGATGWRIA